MKRPAKPEAPAPASRGSSRDRILEAAKKLFSARGYENASTVAIARLAGTSESQLMKHFGNKEGLLEAIFDEAWRRMNLSLDRTVKTLLSPADRLRAIADQVLAMLDRDAELKQLMLLEGRRIRKEGNMVLVTEGFLDFVRLVDGLMREMSDAGQIRQGVNLEAARCALMGALEGLMRDRILARRIGYPARYNSQDLRQVFQLMLAALGTPAGVSVAHS